MRIDIATLFPDMCGAVFSESIVGRGIKNGFIEIYAHNIRDYSRDKHRRVDDNPYGGGTGMVMQPQPIYDCIMDIASKHAKKPRIIYMSPQGEVLTQAKVKQLAAEDGLILLCGHYEGVDQRVLDELGAEEISVGDYVLTGGELPALILADAVARLQKGVLPNEDAYSIESHEGGLLEYPQYTMPREWRGRTVPKELTTGDHKVIAEWQRKQSLRVTKKKRPDMHRKYMDRIFEEFWRDFLAAKGIPEDIGYGEICSFGESEAESNEQLKLIRRGKKRATIRPYTEGAQPPKRGQYKIVIDWDGAPSCVIKTTGESVIPLSGITAEQAQRESGGSPEAWQEKKTALLNSAEQYGHEHSEDMKIIYEEFRLEYKGKKQ